MLPNSLYTEQRDDDYEGETAQIENIEQEKLRFSQEEYDVSDDDYVDIETAIANPLDYT